MPVRLDARQYWGQTTKRWDFDGLSVSLTSYPPLQAQARHCHENPTYFFLLGGDFTDVSSHIGTQAPRPFELLFHPSEAWHEGSSGPSGRYGLNIEPGKAWLERNNLRSYDLGEYRLENDPVRAGELLGLCVCGFDTAHAESQILESLLPSKANIAETPAWFGKLKRLLENEATWNLQSLAEEVAVHPVYLARAFRSRYRCSVSEWLRRKRLLKTASALMEGRPPSEVAHQQGFADQSHFGRSFRAYFGCTPTEFQRVWGK